MRHRHAAICWTEAATADQINQLFLLKSECNLKHISKSQAYL